MKTTLSWYSSLQLLPSYKYDPWCWLMTLLWLTWHHSVALINLSKLSRNIGNIFFSLQAAVSSVVGKRGPTGEVIKYYSLLSLLNLWSQDKLFAPLLLTILTILSYPPLCSFTLADLLRTGMKHRRVNTEYSGWIYYKPSTNIKYFLKWKQDTKAKTFQKQKKKFLEASAKRIRK